LVPIPISVLIPIAVLIATVPIITVVTAMITIVAAVIGVLISFGLIIPVLWGSHSHQASTLSGSALLNLSPSRPIECQDY